MIRKIVTDKMSSVGLPVVVMRLKNNATKRFVTATDATGNFKLEGIGSLPLISIRLIN